MSTSYIFNPDNDLALGNNDANYQAPLSAKRMAYDLSILPAWYATEGDTILLPDSNALYYLERDKETSMLIPRVKWSTLREELPQQPISPWGWNPSLIKLLSQKGLNTKWLPTSATIQDIRQLSNRQFASKLLDEIRLELDNAHPLTGETIVCHTENEVSTYIQAIPQSLLKAPWSGSGKGLRRAQGIYAPPLCGWCKRILQQQDSLIVEPLYNKIVDFAMEFHTTNDSVSFVGYSYFTTDANGAYKGNTITSDKRIEEMLGSYIPVETLVALQKTIKSLLTRKLLGRYTGYVGVDMMIVDKQKNIDHKTENKGTHYLLHPCVEINLRMNMGVVAHTIYERYVSHDSQGIFTVSYYPSNEKLRSTHEEKKKNHPTIISKDGRIIEGYLNLTPIGKETLYIASIEVYRSNGQSISFTTSF